MAEESFQVPVETVIAQYQARIANATHENVLLSCQNEMLKNELAAAQKFLDDLGFKGVDPGDGEVRRLAVAAQPETETEPGTP